MGDLSNEKLVLVLQGGGALGAYQAGALEALAKKMAEPAWVAGISIGSINAAIICGNPAARRVERLRAFWEGISFELPAEEMVGGGAARQLFGEWAAMGAMAQGVVGFFRPRFPWAGFQPDGALRGVSFYDTGPLRETLLRLVDFDYLNSKGPRLSVGAVDVETGNFVYFDSETTTITPEHIMASGALPPGFPSVEIGGRQYWDGGLVSNTPLQYVLENAGDDPLCVVQVDLFPARGKVPTTLAEVDQRQKDIRFSSRTRLTTDRYRQLHDLRAAAERLAARLPKELQDDPDLACLRAAGPACPVTLVHLIHHKQDFEAASKDYEFSHLSMTQHWAAGKRDVKRTFAHETWRNRQPAEGLQMFDLSARPDDF
jgi:NTE family protein